MSNSASVKNYDGHLDREAYSQARAFMVKRIAENVGQDVLRDPFTDTRLDIDSFLDGYLEDRWTPPANSLNEVYRRLIRSAQNAQGMPNAIQKFLRAATNLERLTAKEVERAMTGLNDGYIYILRNVLVGFDPRAIAAKYPYAGGKLSEDLERAGARLFFDIRNAVQSTTKPRLKSPASHWRKFPKSIVSGAKYLSRFPSFKEFHSYVEGASSSEDSRSQLASEISNEVFNIGGALSRDFLKGLGFRCSFMYSKPDVHVMDACGILALTSKPRDVESVSRAVFRVAACAGVPPFAVDKLFWLIGSGRFYEHNKKIGGDKAGFRQYSRERGYPVGRMDSGARGRGLRGRLGCG